MTAATFIFVPGTLAPGAVSPISSGLATQEAQQSCSGAFNTSAFTCVGVPYPGTIWPLSGESSDTLGVSTAAGKAALDAIIKSTPGPKIVSGISQGSIILTQELAALATDPAAPPASELVFIAVADPSRPNGILPQYSFPSGNWPVLDIPTAVNLNTQYNGIVMVQQWDGVADYPQNHVNNWLGVINAVAGFLMLHCFLAQNYGCQIGYQVLPSSDGKVLGYSVTPTTTNYKILNTTTYPLGGKVTTYLMPSWPVPLFDSFPIWVWDIGSLILGAVIEAGYNRAAVNYNTE
jgi:hypothetical protein